VGTPEQIASARGSYTGKYLRNTLGMPGRAAERKRA